MKTLEPETAACFRVHTDWAGYLKIREALEESRVRITYSRGVLELMTPSSRHEKNKTLLGRLLETVLVEREIDFVGAGSTTFQNPKLEQGLEPDECYWIARFDRFLDQDKWLPDRDPPPDLVLEVEVSGSSIDKLELYGKMGVPEVWRYTRQAALVVYRLTAGKYEQLDHSPTLPSIPLSLLEEHVALGKREGTSRAIRALRRALAEPH